MHEPSDLDLIRACLAGDEKAPGFLFHRYFKTIYRYVAGLIGTDEADDAMQEAFLRAWRHLSRFDQKKNFKTWLYRVAHNAALDLLKKRRPMAFSELARSEDGPDPEDLLPDAQEPIPEWLDRQDAAAGLSRALDLLPTAQRNVLKLHYLDELTFAEIAEIRGESINTIKSRSRRALIGLKNLMEN